LGAGFTGDEISCFVSGHDFSRAVNDENTTGFSPWGVAFLPSAEFLKGMGFSPYVSGVNRSGFSR
jgi:hypothetical protein